MLPVQAAVGICWGGPERNGELTIRQASRRESSPRKWERVVPEHCEVVRASKLERVTWLDVDRHRAYYSDLGQWAGLRPLRP